MSRLHGPVAGNLSLLEQRLDEPAQRDAAGNSANSLTPDPEPEELWTRTWDSTWNGTGTPISIIGVTALPVNVAGPLAAPPRSC